MTKKEAQKYIKKAFGEYYKLDEFDIVDYPRFGFTTVHIKSRDDYCSFDIEAYDTDSYRVRLNEYAYDDAGDLVIDDYEDRYIYE